MGGYGSGRWRTGRDTVEGCRQLDINRFTRDGYLDNSAFTWSWTNSNGEQTASIVIWPDTDGLRLQYTVTRYSRKQDMDYLVPITRVRVGFGERPYFLCPCCGARGLKLYLNSQYFTCRRCANLAYESQREKPEERSMRRARKIRRRIGASMSMVNSICATDKPKRMRWRTFYRLRYEAKRFETQGWVLTAQDLERISGRFIPSLEDSQG
jgi:hypothetical protein